MMTSDIEYLCVFSHSPFPTTLWEVGLLVRWVHGHFNDPEGQASSCGLWDMEMRAYVRVRVVCARAHACVRQLLLRGAK